MRQKRAHRKLERVIVVGFCDENKIPVPAASDSHRLREGLTSLDDDGDDDDSASRVMMMMMAAMMMTPLLGW